MTAFVRPAVRRRDPATSAAAAAYVRRRLTEIQRAVLTAYRNRGALSARQAERLPELASWGFSTVRKRVSELAAVGVLEPAGEEYELGPTGSTVYRFPFDSLPETILVASADVKTSSPRRAPLMTDPAASNSAPSKCNAYLHVDLLDHAAVLQALSVLTLLSRAEPACATVTVVHTKLPPEAGTYDAEDENPEPTPDPAPGGKQKRKRRTKAEMEAARVAADEDAAKAAVAMCTTAPEDDTPPGDAAPDAEADTPAVTLDDIKAATEAHIEAHDMESVRVIFKKHKATKMSTIPVKAYAAILADLRGEEA